MTAQAQTRFCAPQGARHGLKVVIVINKIDRENAIRQDV